MPKPDRSLTALKRQVRLLLALFLGFSSFGTMREFLGMLLSTPEGLMFLVVGNAVGAVLALVLFSLTVISFPLLLDRDLDRGVVEARHGQNPPVRCT